MSMIAKEVKDFFDVGMRDNFSPIVIVDKDYRIERVNAAGQALLQKISQSGEEKFEGRCIAEMLPSIKDNSRITDSVFEVKIDGSIYYMVPFRTLRDQDDGTIAILFIDIYANREIESAIAYRREITSDFEEILEGSFDGILVTDAEGKVLFVNSSYERVAEIKRADIEGKYMRDLLNPVWMPESVAHIVAREKTVVSKRQVVKSGRHIMVTGRPVFDEHKNIKKIVINARDITEIYNLTEELQKAKENEKAYLRRFNTPLLGTDDSDNKILAISEPMKQVLMLAEKVANFQVTVLILGESGVGKEEIAKFVHQNSTRKDQPFIVVNCGAIPDNLLESELFGYEKGAFTGAMQAGKAGLFEAAAGGTIFLDEIGEIPLDLQVKLLRFLESKEIRRVGSVDTKIVDVRIVAATNRDLAEMVQEGTFREDLYYRLSVFRIQLPPLRERIEDIELYVRAFVKMFGPGVGKKIEEITPEYLGTLKKHVWKGNVRELRNVIERSMIIADGAVLTVSDLPFDIQQSVLESEGGKGYSEFDLAQVEKAHIRKVLQYTGGNKTEAARLMHIGLTTLYRKIEEYGIR